MEFEELEKAYAKALKLSIVGDVTGELKIRKRLANTFPKSSKLRATLALTFKESGDLVSAEREFREAIVLAPLDEIYSLGLFHILWGQDRFDEAFVELKRFMSVSHSDDYMEIVREINEKW